MTPESKAEAFQADLDAAEPSPQLLMQRLCKSINAVSRCAGAQPWDALKFAEAQKGRSAGEKIAASFVLLVWTQDPNHTEWSGLPAFNITDAAARCDADLRQAIADWVVNPFWP